MDKERKNGKIRGMMHGIPVLIKDNIDTADKMKTTAGSLALIDAPTPKNDAFIVSQMRKAGAVIIGKTNLSEWANFRSTKSSSGWSGRGGQTHNPYILDRNPCGSSAGTGSAIAANLAAIGIGTETDGSIICPSATCGIRRHQTDARFGFAFGNYSDCTFAGHGGTDGANGGGRGDSFRRFRRRRTKMIR